MVAGARSATAPAPTSVQRAALSKATGQRPGPGGPAVSQGAAPTGPSVTSPGSTQAVTSGLTFFRNQRITNSSTSPVDEPSTTQSGHDVFVTGNWYAAYSHNSGGTYTYLNPFSIFGSGFCCDQVTAYDAAHNREFWLLQYGNHLTLANSAASNLASWCSYTWTPASFGLSTTGSFDFNKIAVSTSYVFFSTNVYGVSGVQSLVARFPIEAMTTCAGFSYSWSARNTEFANAFISNAGDTMYFGTNWTNLTKGTTFRIGRWSDISNTLSYFDRTIAAFPFMGGGDGKCGSTDGVVKNWCERSDSRMSGNGYLAPPGRGGTESVLGFAFNAKQDASHPFPFIRRISFRSSDLAYTGSSELFGSTAAYLYPAMASDIRGHIGMAFAWGGGTGTTHYYPGSAIMLDDDVTPNQPWTVSFYQSGAGNPCLNLADNTRRWGDYLDISPVFPAQTTWVASGFAMTSSAGSCGAAAAVSVANVAFGRVRDTASYTRWQ